MYRWLAKRVIGLMMVLPLPGIGTVFADNLQALTLVVNVGHRDAITCAAFSPDGALIATGSVDSTVRIWHARSSRLIRVLDGHKRFVTSLAFTPDCRFLFSGADDQKAILWEVASGKVVCSDAGHHDHVSMVACSADGTNLATGSWDGRFQVLDARTCKRLASWPTPFGSVQVVGFTSDPNTLLVADGGRVCRLVDWRSNTVVGTFQDPSAIVECAVLSHRGDKLFTGNHSGAVTAWDVARQTQLWSSKWHQKAVKSLAISSDGGLIASGGRDGVMRLGDLKQNREIRVCSDHGDVVNAVQFSPDGKLLLTGGTNATALVKRVDTGAIVGTLSSSDGGLGDFAVSNDSTRLLVPHPELTADVSVWDVSDGRVSRRLPTKTLISKVALSDDGKSAYIADMMGNLNLWDADSSRPPRLLGVHKGGIRELAVSGPNNLAVTGAGDGTIMFWDLKAGGPGRQVAGHRGKLPWVMSLSLSQDCRHLLSAGGDGLIHLWDVKTAAIIGELPKQEFLIHVVALSHDGNRAIIASSDDYVAIYNMQTLKEIVRLRGHTNAVVAAVFSPDDSQILTGSIDHSARLWDSSNGHELRAFETQDGSVWSVAFLRHGKDELVLTGGGDRTIRIWNKNTGDQLVSIAYSTDGKWIAATTDGRFDTEVGGTLRDFHWRDAESPIDPLPTEIFLRDYYEPRLLSRVLTGETFRPVRPLGALNRVQPLVNVSTVQAADNNCDVSVTAVVSPSKGTYNRDGKEILESTDVYDLRVFRDGQLVGQWPRPGDGSDGEPEPDPTSAEEMQRWREANRIVADGDRVKLEPGGTLRLSFPARLASRGIEGPVEFMAYAFNEDRVKSETAHFTYKAPPKSLKRRPRAYLVGFGVSASQNADWNLRFAAADAKLTVDEFEKGLEDRYDVVPVKLTSEELSGRLNATATRDNLRSVLQVLSGQKVSSESRAGLPNGSQLSAATPDDLVLLALSCHGYTDQRGTLYLLPYDVGEGHRDITTVLPRCISSADLSNWMRGVDAGELVVILDACHSAASGGPPGFKPAPLGGRGLAQLAYDKGMRVLAASQAKDVALECESVQHGLLTYALVREGLQNRQAMRDGELTLGHVLRYAADRVPDLFEKIKKGPFTDILGRQIVPIAPGNNEFSRPQKPELFDYAARRRDIVISSRRL
jgi:WD40 repeat protein